MLSDKDIYSISYAKPLDGLKYQHSLILSMISTLLLFHWHYSPMWAFASIRGHP